MLTRKSRFTENRRKERNESEEIEIESAEFSEASGVWGDCADDCARGGAWARRGRGAERTDRDGRDRHRESRALCVELFFAESGRAVRGGVRCAAAAAGVDQENDR